jgi:hypothetical protein
MLLPLAACYAGPVPDNAPPMFPELDHSNAIAITLNGQPFHDRKCAPGATYGFHGVELTDHEGNRLRIVQEVQGDTKIIIFQHGAERGTVLSNCSRVEMTESFGRYGASTRGRASMNCEADGMKVEGTALVNRCPS